MKNSNLFSLKSIEIRTFYISLKSILPPFASATTENIVKQKEKGNKKILGDEHFH